MLSLDVCKRLRECGFQQGESVHLHYALESGKWVCCYWRIWDEIGGYDAADLIACPNSDELDIQIIAKVRSLHQKAYIRIEVVIYDYPDGHNETNGKVYSYNDVLAEYGAMDVDPVECRAELYIALSKEDTNESV